MRKLKKRIAALEKDLADLKSALTNMRIDTSAIPYIQVNVPDGIIPVKPGPREGRLDIASGNSILTFFP